MSKRAESSSSSRSSCQVPKRRKKLEEEPEQITMKEEEKQHYLNVMRRDIFPDILSARLSWNDRKLWTKMVKCYNLDVDKGVVQVKRRTGGDLIKMGKELEWCSCIDQEKSACNCIVPHFPNLDMTTQYTCTEQPGSGLAVTWNEIGSSSKDPDDLDSCNSEDLGRKIASQLLKLEISDNFTYEDLAVASFIFNDFLMANNKVPIYLFLQAPKEPKDMKINIIKSLMKKHKST